MFLNSVLRKEGPCLNTIMKTLLSQLAEPLKTRCHQPCIGERPFVFLLVDCSLPISTAKIARSKINQHPKTATVAMESSNGVDHLHKARPDQKSLDTFQKNPMSRYVLKQGNICNALEKWRQLRAREVDMKICHQSKH